jgi:cytochrome o ubiquinol oxidase operon protein cyoD
MIDRNHGWNTSYKPVFIGFVISTLLLVGMLRVAQRGLLHGTLFTTAIFTLAILQALVQLFFFMQVGMESRPKWVSLSFVFTVVVIFIVIGGSLWIMHNLDYNMMPMSSPMPSHGAF